MNLHTAPTTDDRFYRGSDYTFRLKVYDEDENVFDLTGCKAYLRFGASWTDDYSIFEIEGDIVGDPSEGLLRFAFKPRHTSQLRAGSYDYTITIKSEQGQVWPVRTSRLGIIGTNREVENNG